MADEFWDGVLRRRAPPHLKLVESSGQPGGKTAPGSVVLERFDDIELVLADAALIEDVFDMEGLAVIYGASNSGKTFWTMDAALHIAAGRDWRGHRVQQVPVLYLALEGGRGALARIVAWKRRHGITSLPFWLVRAPLSLMLAEHIDFIGKLSAQIEALVEKRPGLIVIDTLARSMAGGNENAPEDMGSLVSGADQIRSDNKGALWFVHHSGKDEARGARGHSSLLAATDTEIEISVQEGGQRIARSTKQREMEKGGEWPFSLEKVVLAEIPDRKPLTSCTVNQIDDGEPARRKRPGGQPGHALQILTDVLATSGTPAFPSASIPASAIIVNVNLWREAFYLRAMSDAGIETKQKAFRRAVDDLSSRGFVAQYGASVWKV